MPDPSPEKKVYATDAVPADWGQKSNDQKIEWLNTQGTPSDPSVNLGDCYRRGAKLTRIFRIVFNLLGRVRDAVIKKASDSLKKYLNAFLAALNASVGRLNNFIYNNCDGLIKNGKFMDANTPLTPVSIPDLPTIDDNDATTAAPAGTDFKSTFWGIFLDTLAILVDSWPWLNKVQPPMELSYAQLLKTAMEAGHVFFVEFQKSAAGTKPQDEDSVFLFILVNRAVGDEYARNIWPKQIVGETPAGEGDTDVTVRALDDLQGLPPAWERIR